MKTKLLKKLRKEADKEFKVKKVKSGYLIYAHGTELRSLETKSKSEALCSLWELQREYILRILHRDYCHYYKE